MKGTKFSIFNFAVDPGVGQQPAFGQAADGTVLMLCIEGRFLDSLGATAPECAEILAQYGACQAMNLDGGTSAILWYDGEYITRCSDPDLPEGRLLPNCWIYQ